MRQSWEIFPSFAVFADAPILTPRLLISVPMLPITVFADERCRYSARHMLFRA